MGRCHRGSSIGGCATGKIPRASQLHLISARWQSAGGHHRRSGQAVAEVIRVSTMNTLSESQAVQLGGAPTFETTSLRNHPLEQRQGQIPRQSTTQRDSQDDLTAWAPRTWTSFAPQGGHLARSSHPQQAQLTP